MIDLFELIFWPLLTTMLLTLSHVYFGMHVVSRGVIFVDLALAQVAALGTTVGLIIGLEHDDPITYLLAVVFTLLGAGLFSITRHKDHRVPQEAIIGITYVVAAAVMVLLFSKSAEGAEEMSHLLVGSILFATPTIFIRILGTYAILGMIHFYYRDSFFRSTSMHAEHAMPDRHSRFWDFLFYLTFGFMVTSSVKVAGVLLVFSYLIIPAIVALLFVQGYRKRLIFGAVFGLIASIIGMLMSLWFDLPPAATIVASLGGGLALLALAKVVLSPALFVKWGR